MKKYLLPGGSCRRVCRLLLLLTCLLLCACPVQVKAANAKVILKKGHSCSLMYQGSKVKAYSTSNKKVIKLKSGKITCVGTGTATIRFRDQNKKIRKCKFEVVLSTTDFLNTARSLASRIAADGNWPWVYAPRGKTWAKALKYHETSCANFVSLCLQQYGILPKGNCFYTRKDGQLIYQGSASQKSASKKAFKKYFKIIPGNGRSPAEVMNSLVPGDILGLYDGHTQHCTIYAGRDDQGNTLWYDMGSDGTSDSTKTTGNGMERTVGCFNRVVKTGGNEWGKLAYILRMKNTYEARTGGQG